MGIAEREEREKEKEEFFETIITEIFPKFMSDTKTQIQKAQRMPSRTNDNNICRTLQIQLKNKYVFFSICETFTKIDYMLGYKGNKY